MWPHNHNHSDSAPSYYPSYEAYHGWHRSGINQRSVYDSNSFARKHPRCLPEYPGNPPSLHPRQQSSPQHTMNPTSSWVERGQDGRPYFVRKKTKLPSTFNLISTILPRRSNSLPFTRAFQKDHIITPAPVSTPLALPPPPPGSLQSPANPELNPTQPSFPAPRFQPNQTNMYPLPCQRAIMQDRSNNNGNKHDHQGSGLKSQQQFFPGQHPAMYPIPSYPSYPPQPQQPPHPQMGPLMLLPRPVRPTAPPPHPFHPTGVFPAPPLPPGARMVSPPRFPTADDMKYKCRVCGRFRSSRYHYKNPIPPGQLPAETVCRRCRENATDSEDESEDAWVQRPTRRGRSRSRSVNSAVVFTEPTRSNRGRSLSRVEVVPRSRSRMSSFTDRRHIRTRSSSSSSEPEPLRITIDDNRRYRGYSPGETIIERVRYIEDPPQRRPALLDETIYYEEDSRGRRRRIYEDELYDGDREYDYPTRTRRISRPPTPLPRVIRRQYSDPVLRNPREIEHRVYFDGSPPNVGSTTELVRMSRPVSRASSRTARVRSRPARQLSLSRQLSESEESFNTIDLQEHKHRGRGWYEEHESRGHRRGHRSRSRQSSFIAEGGETARRPSWLAEAPSPPPQFNSSLGYMEPRPRDEQVEYTRSTEDAAVDFHGRPTTVTRRRRSRSRSVIGPERAETLLRPGDVVTVIEKRRAPAEDYDWYDKDGMRVRVREI